MKKAEINNFYKEFNDKMIIRDYLALDRTILANRRTLLSYVRTFIGLFGGGIGLVELLDNTVIMIIGYISMGISLPILIIGINEFIKMKKSLESIFIIEEDKINSLEKEDNI